MGWLIDDAPAPHEVPPPFRRLAGLLAAAAAPPRPGELAGEAEAVAAFVAAFDGVPVEEATFRRRPMILQVLTTKAAAGVMAGGVLFGGGAAAAATGKLPDAAQDAVHNTLSHVGVHVPDAANAVVDDPASTVCAVAGADPCPPGVEGGAQIETTPGVPAGGSVSAGAGGAGVDGGATVNVPGVEVGANVGPGGVEAGATVGVPGVGGAGANVGPGGVEAGVAIDDPLKAIEDGVRNLPTSVPRPPLEPH